MTPDEARTQVVRLKAMEAARTKPTGEPLPGYRRNVELLRREIRRLEAGDLADVVDCVALEEVP